MAALPGMYIGIPSSGRPVDIRWAFAWQVLAINAPVGSFTTTQVEIGPDRAGNRELLAEKALEAGARYLFMLDDDTVPPNYALRHLSYAIEQHPDVMVIGGIYTTKEEQPRPLVFKTIGDGVFWRWKAGDVFDVEGIGTGCMLIKTEVFRHLPKPWFFEPKEAPINEYRKVGDREIQVGHRSGTDDLYFCQKVIDAGFKIKAHGGVLCAHIGQNGTVYTLPEDSYPMQEEENISKALTIPGWMQPDELRYLASEAKKSKTIIEVGSWLGRSTCALAQNTKGKVIAVDTWEGSAEHRELMAGKDKDWAYNQFLRNTEGLPVTPIRDNSLVAAEKLKEMGIRADLIFIDASHDYESVKADILAWTEVLAPGGVICGHDFSAGWQDVQRAVTEVVPEFRVVNTIWTTRGKDAGSQSKAADSDGVLEEVTV